MMLNSTPRPPLKLSPAAMHFGRETRHGLLPQLDEVTLEVDKAYEEINARREKRKARANDKVSSFIPSPLQLKEGLRVLVQDQKGRYSIKGVIKAVRSERSCHVENLETGNLLLRNRRFLRQDPEFATPGTVMMVTAYMKPCIRAHPPAHLQEPEQVSGRQLEHPGPAQPQEEGAGHVPGPGGAAAREGGSQVPRQEARSQVPGARCQVPGARCQVPGAK